MPMGATFLLLCFCWLKSHNITLVILRWYLCGRAAITKLMSVCFQAAKDSIPVLFATAQFMVNWSLIHNRYS